MRTTDITDNGTWVPQACTLPTVEQPVRVAEFDDFFAHEVRNTERLTPTTLKLDLDPTGSTAATAGRLIADETGCCSFFTFTLRATGDGLTLTVEVPHEYVDVLDALARRT